MRPVDRQTGGGETGVVRALAVGAAAVALLTGLFVQLGITNPTIVALSFLLVVLLVATFAPRRVAVATSLMSFGCFNYFFLPPVRTFTIADPENWVALFTLLTVSLVASHLSSQVRQRAHEALVERTRFLEERKDAEVIRRGAELKSALLASLSHDFKTPLTAVTVAANNLNASWLTDEQRREQAEIVRLELDRLNRLFEDILDLARIDTDAVAAEPEWVHPAEIVEAAARQVEPALSRHTLVTDVGTAQYLVHVDPRLTSAALAHLFENAAQYSPPGSTIEVAAFVKPDELQFSVHDSGNGIAPQDVGHIFERFYRGAGALEQRFGTGMGLAITRGLLAAEGGRVWAENHPKGGAVFTVALPAASRAAEAIEPEKL